MKMSNLCLIALGAGIFLVVLSFIWPSIIRGAVWSEQQASEHAEAAAELHRLSHARAHGAGPASGYPAADKEGDRAARLLEEAKQRYERSQAMLQRARSYRQGIAGLLRGAGAVCSLLGGGFFLLRRAAG
jgi:hypothetical protein